MLPIPSSYLFRHVPLAWMEPDATSQAVEPLRGGRLGWWIELVTRFRRYAAGPLAVGRPRHPAPGQV
jgi:hypothetical protein